MQSVGAAGQWPVSAAVLCHPHRSFLLWCTFSAEAAELLGYYRNFTSCRSCTEICKRCFFMPDNLRLRECLKLWLEGVAVAYPGSSELSWGGRGSRSSLTEPPPFWGWESPILCLPVRAELQITFNKSTLLCPKRWTISSHSGARLQSLSLTGSEDFQPHRTQSTKGSRTESLAALCLNALWCLSW